MPNLLFPRLPLVTHASNGEGNKVKEKKNKVSPPFALSEPGVERGRKKEKKKSMACDLVARSLGLYTRPLFHGLALVDRSHSVERREGKKGEEKKKRPAAGLDSRAQERRA